jgi:hypothetical protein
MAGPPERRVSWRGAVLARAAGFRLAGQDSGQPGEQDVEAAFEFGGAVAGGQDRVLDEFLEIVQDVAVQELAP